MAINHRLAQMSWKVQIRKLSLQAADIVQIENGFNFGAYWTDSHEVSSAFTY